MRVNDGWGLRMYLCWSLCTLYLHACQVRVTVSDSGLSVLLYLCNIFWALTDSLVCWQLYNYTLPCCDSRGCGRSSPKFMPQLFWSCFVNSVYEKWTRNPLHRNKVWLCFNFFCQRALTTPNFIWFKQEIISVENTVQQTPNFTWLKQEIISAQHTVQQTPNFIQFEQEIIPVENTVQQIPHFIWLKQNIIPVENTVKKLQTSFGWNKKLFQYKIQ